MTKKIQKSLDRPDMELRLTAQKETAKLVQQTIKEFPAMDSIDRLLQLVNKLIRERLELENRIETLTTSLAVCEGERLLDELELKKYKQTEPPPSVG